jgi:hypothetical protein
MSVVVLQNGMDFLEGELGVYTETCVTSNVDRNGDIGVAAERVSDIKVEEDEEPTEIPEIKTEPKVSCMPVVSVNARCVSALSQIARPC